MGVNVIVGVPVMVAVNDGVNVNVGRGVKVRVGVQVCVAVGVTVGMDAIMIAEVDLAASPPSKTVPRMITAAMPPATKGLAFPDDGPFPSTLALRKLPKVTLE